MNGRDANGRFTSDSKGNYRHGGRHTRLYHTWCSIKARCYNRNNKEYILCYGSKGIKMCDEWKNSFIIFREWALNNGYSDNLTIDRINGNGNYEPSNCQWITKNLNSQKTSRNKLNLEIARKIRGIYKISNLSTYDLANIFNVCRSNIGNIINNKIWREVI